LALGRQAAQDALPRLRSLLHYREGEVATAQCNPRAMDRAATCRLNLA
jgi:hypothetical protein